MNDLLHASSAPRGVNVVFNELVPTSCKVNHREDMNRPLGILVATSIGGPTGHSNVIRVRLTDPTDPFFLFQLELVEDDYGRFKNEQQLHVDFHEFSADFAGMLDSVVQQASAISSMDNIRSGTERRLLFAVPNSASSTAQLFVQEITRVKTTNIFELQLTREGDVGQKHYLAEQFEHFQVSYYDSESQRKEQAIAMERTIGELRGSLATLEKERSEVEGQLKVGASESESRLQQALLQRQDDYTAEMKALRTAADEERAALTTKLDELTQRLREIVATKDMEISNMQRRVNSLEHTEASLRGQLNVKTIEYESQAQEAQHLAAQVEHLSSDRSSNLHSMGETKLHVVQLTERLAAAERHAKERIDETRVLREQAFNDAATIRTLTDQVKERSEKTAEVESDLKKAHHIIGNQLQASKQQKDKFASVVQQLNDTRFLLDQQQQKNTESGQQLDANREENRKLLRTIEQLKEQLHAVTDDNEKLEEDLKLARNAVVHVQRHGAYSIGRNLNSISGAPGMAPSQDLYRQYAANVSNVGAGSVPHIPVGTSAGPMASSSNIIPNVYGKGQEQQGVSMPSLVARSMPYTTSTQFYNAAAAPRQQPQVAAAQSSADAPTAYFN
jgi:spindle assembly abnormal protein 6